jgi:RNA recognition motif-containing protein
MATAKLKPSTHTVTTISPTAATRNIYKLLSLQPSTTVELRSSGRVDVACPPANNSGAPFHRFNVHFSVTEDDLSDIFSGYGELEQITL